MNLAEAWEAMEKLTPCEVRTETGWKRTLITAIIAHADVVQEGIEIRVIDPRKVYWDGKEFRKYSSGPMPMQDYGPIEMSIDSVVLPLHLRIAEEAPLQGEGGRSHANHAD